MKITRRSPIDGKERTFDLNITQRQMDAYAGGALAQNAFPQLSADQREWLMTGVMPEQWDYVFAGSGSDFPREFIDLMRETTHVHEDDWPAYYMFPAALDVLTLEADLSLDHYPHNPLYERGVATMVRERIIFSHKLETELDYDEVY